MRSRWSVALGLVGAGLPLAAATVAIKVDQAGYLPGGPKIAAVVAPGNPHSFTVHRSSDGGIALQSILKGPVSDPDSGDAVYTADFTKLVAPGRYYVEVAGVGQSWNFEIGPAVFQRAYYLTARSFYGQRCGTAVDLGPEFPQHKHAACHLVGDYNASTGKIGNHVSQQGWHDAGDYGRYIPNSGISTATLLWAVEMFGSKLSKVDLHLPDSADKAPGLLQEARWNVEWMLTMQDSDGGVWHKQTSAHFAPFIMPEKDTLVSEVIGTGTAPFKSSCATGDFAAVLAITSRLYRPYDRAFADQMLAAAESAWRWLSRNPNVTFKNPAGVATGEYGDDHCGDERLWASAELGRTTGKDSYSQFFLSQYRDYLSSISAATPPSWAGVAPLGLWTYVLGKGKDAAAVSAIREQTLKSAGDLVARRDSNGYRQTLSTADYIWGSNGVAGNEAMQLLIANAFAPDRRFVEAANDNVHYLLGRNTFSLSWVTQVGEHPFQHPHHRPSAADGVEAPWPGLLSGGPNRGRQDPVAKKSLGPDLPPARNYLDETGAYALNEVAINWNAPLVFTLAALLPD